jgi:hypothetical protein
MLTRTLRLCIDQVLAIKIDFSPFPVNSKKLLPQTSLFNCYFCVYFRALIRYFSRLMFQFCVEIATLCA